MSSENKGPNKKPRFVLNEMVKRKILEMYNISKKKDSQKTAQDDPDSSTEKSEEHI